jgi:hypothetical protein
MAYYFNAMERLDLVLKLKPENHQEWREEIIEAFQEGRINDEEKQGLMARIDELLNNHYNYLAFVQQQPEPNQNLVINLEEAEGAEGAEEVGAGAGAGQNQDGGRLRHKLRQRRGRVSQRKRQQGMKRKTTKNRRLRRF